MGQDATQWFWCLDHARAEPAGEACAQDKRLGPYESEHAARNWKQRHQQREEHWEEQDEARESRGADDGDSDPAR